MASGSEEKSNARLDGRQVAVLAALGRDPADAADIVAQTAPGEPWENAVTACLAVMCRRLVHHPVGDLLSELVETYVRRQPDPGTTLFDTRLGLTILDLLDKPDGPEARRIAEELHHRATTSTDGYAARDCLADSRFTNLMQPKGTRAARGLVRACALGSGDLRAPRFHPPAAALRLSDEVIRMSVGPPRSTGHGPMGWRGREAAWKSGCSGAWSNSPRLATGCLHAVVTVLAY